jgi:hypothetical protein
MPPPPCPSSSGVLLPVGWKERVDFPDWRLRRIKAKVDTGARTSALGVVRCELTDDEGSVTARLHIASAGRRAESATVIETPVVRMTVVVNSGGAREQRPVVEALVRLGPVVKRIRLTVTSRAGMRCPMLLGREALEGMFVVDVSRKYLLHA